MSSVHLHVFVKCWSLLSYIFNFFYLFLLFLCITLQWLNSQKLVESLVSLIDPEIDEDVSTYIVINFFF